MRISAIVMMIMAVSSIEAVAVYRAQELFTINWGDEIDEFKFSGPTHNFNPEDSTDDVDPGSGPSAAYVDKENNIIIVSNDYRQIKGFTPDGNVIFSFSPQETPGFDSICWDRPSSIYVDSNALIYVGSFEPMPYVPVVDFHGDIVDKLYPFPDSESSKIIMLKWSPIGRLYFCERVRDWVSYYNGEFSKTGWAGLLANDGYFYSASWDDEKPYVLYIYRRGGVDSSGHAEYVYTMEIDLGQDSLSYAEELLGGDGNNIYVYAGIYPDSFYRDVIWVYDLNFDKVDELMFPLEEEESYLSIMPFVSAAGEIYEFRFLHDGLHVIKWKK